jgi:hypothetical protein
MARSKTLAMMLTNKINYINTNNKTRGWENLAVLGEIPLILMLIYHAVVTMKIKENNIN